mgnify:CR=1 FL=1
MLKLRAISFICFFILWLSSREDAAAFQTTRNNELHVTRISPFHPPCFHRRGSARFQIFANQHIHCRGGSTTAKCNSQTDSSNLPTTEKRGRNRLLRWMTRLRIREPQRRRRLAAMISAFLAFFLFQTHTANAIAKKAMAGASSGLSTPTLGLQHILKATTLISAVGGLGLTMIGLPSLARQLIFACTRCTLQLQLLGGIILQMLLPTPHAWIILVWILGVGTIAAQEAYGRIEYTYPTLRRDLTISFLAGVGSVLTYALCFQVFGTLKPWFQPKTLIPVAGMLFGNTLSAVTLAASTLTREFATNQKEVELWLSRGATYQEAILPLTKETIRTALTPTINALSVTGIVHLPGMMTAQILAGQSPQQAALYQTLIWFLIASVASLTVQLLTQFITHALVDKREHRLVHMTDLVVGSSTKKKENIDKQATKAGQDGEVAMEIKAVTLASNQNIKNKASRKTTAGHVLNINNVHIRRANVTFSFDLYQGDILGITGESGRGKSQVLRTIAGLEKISSSLNANKTADPDTPILQLNDSPISQWSFPEWRTKVCLVSQDRPTFTGSPRMFFERIQGFRYQQKKKREESKNRPEIINGSRKNKNNKTLEEMITNWNLDESILDRTWSTLSGGESQRVSLAIALALKPDVLLLDEFASALDDATSRLVEGSLGKSGIAIIIVTHSRQQLDRFCTHHIELPSRSVVGSGDVDINVESGKQQGELEEDQKIFQ